MKPVVRILLLATSTALAGACRSAPSDCGPPPADVAAVASADRIDLSERLGGGRLRSVNRAVTAFPAGAGIRVTAAPGVGVIWLEGTDFAEGTIEADVCGRDVDGESFVGIAF